MALSIQRKGISKYTMTVLILIAFGLGMATMYWLTAWQSHNWECSDAGNQWVICGKKVSYL